MSPSRRVQTEIFETFADFSRLGVYISYRSGLLHINTVTHIHTGELASVVLRGIGIPGHVSRTERSSIYSRHISELKNSHRGGIAMH